jgi:tRNA A37 threonylcarbamoyladenosine biosynthesis protein TsaE
MNIKLKIKINHYDLFRLKSSEELKNLDLFEDKSKYNYIN